MAAVTMTPANVTIVSGNVKTGSKGGATLTAGQFVYADSSDSGELKAGAVTSAAAANIVGMLISPVTDGKPAFWAGSGAIITGGTFTKGVWYVLGASGAIQLVGDLTTGQQITWLGYGLDDGTLKVSIHATGETAA